MVCHDDPFATIERRFLVPKAVDLAAEDGRETARRASQQGLDAMPTMAEIYPVGGQWWGLIMKLRKYNSPPDGLSSRPPSALRHRGLMLGTLFQCAALCAEVTRPAL